MTISEHSHRADSLARVAAAASGAGTLRQYDYATDRIGNRTSVADADDNASNWSYDPLGQLRADYYLSLSERK